MRGTARAREAVVRLAYGEGWVSVVRAYTAELGLSKDEVIEAIAHERAAMMRDGEMCPRTMKLREQLTCAA